MKYITSFQELDALGEGLSKDYTKKAHKQNALPFDIEGFITGYLGMHRNGISRIKIKMEE